MAGGMGGYGGQNLPPMQPMQPPPVREKRSGANGCLIGGLAGCGILIVLVVIGSVLAMNTLKNSKGGGGIGKFMSSIQTGQEFTPKLTKVGAALTQYKEAHDGKYPASLNALIPKYLPNKSDFTPTSNETTIEYTPPKPDAKPDAIVLSVTNGEANISFGAASSRSTLYYRLLKDGSLVQDQVQRVTISGKGGAKQNP